MEYTNLKSVCLYGCSDNVARSLALALRHRSNGRFRVSDPRAAELALIDYEGVGGEESFAAIEQFLQIPYVVLAEARGRHHGRHLQKPLRFSELVDALDSLLDAPSGAAAQRPAEAARAPGGVEPEPESIDLDRFLVGFVAAGVRAHREKGRRGFRIPLANDRWLQFDVERGAMFANVERGILDHLAVVSIDQLHLKMVDADPLIDPCAVPFGAEIDAFLWRCAQACQRGIAAGYDAHTRYRLKHCPNLLSEIGDARWLAVMNYWLAVPSTLADIARQFDLEVRSLLPLLNACVACGVVQRADDRPAAAAEPRRRNIRSVLRMILSRFAADA